MGRWQFFVFLWVTDSTKSVKREKSPLETITAVGTMRAQGFVGG
jgi:hypothetical protein